MVSSVLKPEKIVGRQNTNKAAAQNFISGGSILGASVVNGAANKIVGFQRAGVQPAAPVVNNIVSTITTNINNNVTNVINKTLQGFSADYQKRIKQVDDAKPIGILGKFLNVYKTALGFINFFGNKKNIDKVRDNLEVLKKSFTESFEVAKLIRQVIIKIVKQLSNLPVASPSGGGGLNLDVDIPGGGLRKSAPRGLQRMMGGKGKMLALGAGALGLGALGAGAVNALSDSPQDQAQAAQTTPEIPGDTIDRFSSIVDRFANAISAMFKTQKDKPKGSPGGGGGGSRSPGGPSPGGPSPGGPSPGINPPDTGIISGNQEQIESQMFDYLKQNYGENVAYGMLSNAMRESGYRTNAPEGGYFGMFQLDKNREAKFREWAKSKNLDPMSNQAQLQYGVIEAQQLGTLERMKASKTPEDAASLFYNEFERAAYSKPIVGSAYTPDNPHEQKNRKFLQQIRERQSKRTPSTILGAPPAPVLPSPTPKPGVGGPDLPDLMLSPQKREELKLSATTVSQPPPSQQQQQPIIMPINLGGGGQQQSGGGGMSGPPPSQGSGPSVPFLPAGNPDNFLVLYSRMVYNIVDG